MSDIDVDINEILLAHQCLDCLSKKISLSRAVFQQTKSALDKKPILSNLKLNVFHFELHALFQQVSQHTLSGLFAELQHWLLPEENLPPAPMDSALLSTLASNYDESTSEKIHRFQDPLHLRSFLDMENTEIVMRLHATHTPQNTLCPAAELLALILFYHSQDKIKEGENEQPLLNGKQIVNGVLALNKLYSLSPAEQLVLSAHQQQCRDIQSLRCENASLREEVASMGEKIDTLLDMVKQLMPKQEAKRSRSPMMF